MQQSVENIRRHFEIEEEHVKRIIKKNEGIIAHQNVEFQLLKMTVPLKNSEGFSRELQLELNAKQRELTSGLMMQIKDEEEQ